MFVTYYKPRPQINYTSNDHIEYTENVQQPASYFIYLFTYLFICSLQDSYQKDRNMLEIVGKQIFVVYFKGLGINKFIK